MHISEGVLSVPILATGYGLTVAGTAMGLKKLDGDRVMNAALLAAGFFVASLIHVPLGPSSMHLVFTGLIGLMLGWAAFPAVLAGLCLQAVLFQYGSISTLGVNTFNMAAPAVICGFLFWPFISPERTKAAPLWALYGGAGLLASLLALALPGIIPKLAPTGVYYGVMAAGPLLLLLSATGPLHDAPRPRLIRAAAFTGAAALLAVLILYRFTGPEFTDMSALPVNAIVPGLCLTFFLHRRLHGPMAGCMAASFAAGALPVLLSSVLTAASLVFTDEGFFATARILVLGHIPVSVVEGLITVSAVAFLIKVRPEMLGRPVSQPGGTS